MGELLFVLEKAICVFECEGLMGAVLEQVILSVRVPGRSTSNKKGRVKLASARLQQAFAFENKKGKFVYQLLEQVCPSG